MENDFAIVEMPVSSVDTFEEASIDVMRYSGYN